MNKVDFLPAGYRQRKLALTQSRNRLIAVGALALALLGLHGAQRTWLGVERASALRTSLRLAEAEQFRARHTMLQEQAALHTSDVELALFLDHPWPTTGILKSLASDVPASVHFKELRMSRPKQSLAGQPVAETALAQPAMNPLAADLAQLKKLHDNQRATITLRGQTTSRSDLYRYVGELERGPFVEHPRLHSVIAVLSQGEPEWSFVIEATVRPGYGQAGFIAAQSPRNQWPAEERLP